MNNNAFQRCLKEKDCNVLDIESLRNGEKKSQLYFVFQ